MNGRSNGEVNYFLSFSISSISKTQLTLNKKLQLSKALLSDLVILCSSNKIRTILRWTSNLFQSRTAGELQAINLHIM